MLEFVYKIWQLIYQTGSLPFSFIYYIIWVLYRFVFFIQIYMCTACRGIFGDGFGCDIIDPAYVFTTVAFNTIKLAMIVYIGIKMVKTWNKWKDSKKDE